MAQFMCDRNDRCCPHEFYDSIEQAISDFEDGVPCDHLIEVAPVRHGRWLPTTKWWQGGSAWKRCSECGILHLGEPAYCHCGAKMDGGKTDD